MVPVKEITKFDGRLFAIGDIHGCPAETEILLTWLERNEGLNQDDTIIFIGDYIDRGTASKAVIEYLLEFKKKFPQTIFLKGNHEDMLLSFLGFEGTNGDAYIKNGGDTTLDSYGLPPNSAPEDVFARIPKSHIDFISNLDSVVRTKNHIFVHAGLNPRKPFSRQSLDDIYWIREGFIDEVHSFGKIIIFGHTPHAELLYDVPYKIGIDTGLVYGNKLSCIELTHNVLYQIVSKGREIVVANFPLASQ